MTLIKTLSPKNEARIVCPVFNAETRLADCFALEQELARGRVQPERKGCQACLRSSKCPIFWMNREIRQNGSDHYHSAEPKVVSLRPNILDDIGPIVVQTRHLSDFGVSGDELDAIVAANEAVTSGAKRSKKAPAVKLGRVQAEERSVTRSQPAQESDELTQAALSGDMSAAVTRAAQAKPDPVPEPAPAPKPFPEVGPPAMRNSAAVMNAIQEPPAPAPKPTPKPAPAPAAAPTKGLSLLELARQRAQQKAAAA